MRIFSRIHNSSHFLFYLGMILITFNIFPFQDYGLGASKALSMIPLILYDIQKLFEKKYILPSSFVKEIIIIIMLILISSFIGVFVLDSLDGTSTAISMWGSYVIIFFAFNTFISQADGYDVKLMLECIFFSFKISFVFGVLEVIQFTIFNDETILEIIRLFVRDDVYLRQGRLQFNFGEPGDAGTIIVLLLIPVVYFLKKNDYKFSKFEIIVIIGIFLMEAFFSKSGSYVSLLIVFLVAFLIIKLANLRKKMIFFIPFMLTIVIILFFISQVDWSTIAHDNDVRLLKLATERSDAFAGDNSSGVRFGMWVISFEVWKNHYLLGTGVGNFGYFFKEGIQVLDLVYFNSEMFDKMDMNLQQTYSVISTALVEGGILGCVWLILFFKKIQWKDKTMLYFIPPFLVSLLQNMVIYQPVFCLVYFMLSNKKIIRLLDAQS